MPKPLASLYLGALASGLVTERKRDAEYRVEWVDHAHSDRAGLQAFIASAFFDMYGAEVHHFCDTLVGCRDAEGKWTAAVGFTLAKNGNTFLEQYLDSPLENEIASRTGSPVCRQQIVEVGNLAARHRGAARKLIISMTDYLHQMGMTWVAFTATRGLLNSFNRLCLQPSILVNADPSRLADGGKSWGSYYSTKPQVMFGDIRTGYAQLAK